MVDTASRPSRASKALNLPNLLTVGRIAAVPALVVCLYVLEGNTARWTAFGIFVVAAVTDWLDGYLARAWEQQSAIGAMLDPIADKLIVGATLMMLVYDGTISGLGIFAALTILCREILVSGLREYLAGLHVKVLVTMLAKWKTFVQMLALGALLAGPALEGNLPGATAIGIALLWVAAVLTIWTGSAYLKAAIGHAANA